MDPFHNPPPGVAALGTYPGQFATAGDGGMVAPPGWVSPNTPGSATVQCGNVVQTESYATTTTTPEPIGFTAPSTWSSSSFTPDVTNTVWTCETSGIYNLRFNQTVTATATEPVLFADTTVVSNTLFYLDAEQGTAPVSGTLALSQDLAPTTTVNLTSAPGTVMMAEFITPVGFLSSVIIPGGDWNLTVLASTTGTSGGVTVPTEPLYIGQYYKSANQNAPTGSTEVTFDTATNWLNTNGYIDHTNGTADFTCLQAGVYQLEFSAYMSANGSTWTVLSKDVAINITRIGIAEQQILRNRFSSTSGLDWSNSLVGTVELQAGDIVQCVVTQTVTGTPLILGVQNTFDYNTTFTFTYVKQLANIGAPGMNSLYFSVFSVDEDGTGNEETIVNGSQGLPPTVINSASEIFYRLTQTIPPTRLVGTTRRIIIRIYATFATTSTINLFFRNLAISTAQTTLPQSVVPLVEDNVDLRITVSATTTEFNQVFATSIPVSLAEGASKVYSGSVNCIANVQAGDTITCTIASVDGLLQVESGLSSLPDPANTLQWNLIAQGAYGNVGVIV